MRVGFNFFPTDQAIEPIQLGEALEERGFESLWLAEHSHIPVNRLTPWGGRKDAPPLPEYYGRTHDSFVTLAAVAARTERLLLGTGIALVAQRDPIWLAKQVASLDVISNGRFLFGIGYGWNKEEMAHHGVPYTERRQLLGEKIEMMKALWTQDEASYDGELLKLDRSWAWPKPLQKPHPPVIMGGSAGPKTFADIASFCDGWMPIVGRSDIESNISTLHQSVAAVGRDPSEIELSVYAAPVDQALWARLEDLGFSRALIHLPSAPADVVIPMLDEYLPLLET